MAFGLGIYTAVTLVVQNKIKNINRIEFTVDYLLNWVESSSTQPWAT